MKRAIDYLRECLALCVSIDGFSDTNSSSVFNIRVGGPIPFQISSFRLGSRREPSVNIDLAVSQTYNTVINISNDTPPVKAYVMVTDSPNVMVKARQLSSGLESSGSGFVTFAYGRVCHA